MLLSIIDALAHLRAIAVAPGRTLRRAEANGMLARMPLVLLEEAVPETSDSTVPIPMAGLGRRGTQPYGERLCIGAVTAALDPRVVFEIGTFDGTGTRFLARMAPRAQIHTLDLGGRPAEEELEFDRPLRDSERVGSAFRATPEEARITTHTGDSLHFDFSPWRGEVDLVVVDGGHGYRTVLSDARNAWKMVRPGGVIVFDDCDTKFPSVVRALLDWGRPVQRIFSTRLAMARKEPQSEPADS